MSFAHSQYLIPLIAVVAIGIIFWLKFYQNFHHWIKDSFGLKISFFNKLQKTFFILSVILTSLGLLDLRGPEEYIDSPISDQKTIILIDTSASMLVEDVQPNRFKRALTVARHFVKSAAGHQISILLFSDITKRLIPFTDDVDLLDARLAGLEDESLRGGSSNISASIAETVMALKRETSNGKQGGNILLITDAEENGEELKLESTAGISLAVIGIGTVSGGKIPMRTKKGTFTGYKTHMNKEVISKLDEAYLDRIVSVFDRAKKWVVLSYTMPTESVLDFFREGANSTTSIDQNKVRPVLTQWLFGAGALVYIFSVLLGSFRSYVLMSVALLLFINVNIPKAYANQEEVAIDSLSKNWDGREKQKIAFEFLKNKENEKANLLYEEADKSLTPEARANWGASLLEKGDLKGIEILNETLRQNDGGNVELDRVIRANIKKFYSQKGGGGGGKSDEEKESDSKDKNNSGEGQGESGSSKDQSQSDAKNEEKESKDPSDSDSQGNEKKDQQKQITNVAQREREIDRQRRMMKVPALLKQLMQDDRALQSQFIDTQTQEQVPSRQKKDW